MKQAIRQVRLTENTHDGWPTPVDLLTSVEEFLGPFMDPCPYRQPGQPFVNGLALPWRGAVYVNPPYGAAIKAWIVKAVTEPVDELVLLVPARTDTKWFRMLWRFPMCFVYGRLHFGGGGVAPFASVLVYRGPRSDEFARHFAHWGAIVKPYN